MKLANILGAFLFVSFYAFSSGVETTPSPMVVPAQEPPKSREVNIQHMMVKPADLDPQEKAKSVKMTCETSDGKSLKKGEPGYEACLYDIKLKAKGSTNKVGVGFGSD